VGLLAAKALDFYPGKTIKDYANCLHKIWSLFLRIIGRPYAITPEKRQAYNFYISHKYDYYKACSHMGGIDFSKPVYLYELKSQTKVYQWKAKNIPQGNYYAKFPGRQKRNYYAKPASTPSCLGIHDEQQDKNTENIEHREPHGYKINSDIEVLCSIAASVIDTWSITDEKHLTQGGCVQYFNENDKDEFKEVNAIKCLTRF